MNTDIDITILNQLQEFYTRTRASGHTERSIEAVDPAGALIVMTHREVEHLKARGVRAISVQSLMEDTMGKRLRGCVLDNYVAMELVALGLALHEENKTLRRSLGAKEQLLRHCERKCQQLRDILMRIRDILFSPGGAS